MKVIKLLTIIAFCVLSLSSFGQLQIIGDSVLCSDTLTLQANVQNISATSYRVDSIPFNPRPTTGSFQLVFNPANRVFTGWNMAFNFCYFGNQYTNINISESGWVSFSNNPQSTATYDPTPLPSAAPTMPINVIMGAFSDHAASLCVGGCVRVQTAGAAPFRRFITTWVDIPHNQCTDSSYVQIVLYETTNIIEVHINQKPLCLAGIGGGAATIGIQNITGTTAFTPSNRNATVWSTQNESWRFVPDNITWYDAAGTVLDTAKSITVSPSASTFYYAESEDCSGNTLIDTIYITNPVDSALISGGGNYSTCSDSVLVTALDPSPRSGRWSIVSGSLTIEDPDSLSTLISNITTATSYLKWSVFNGCDTISDTVGIFLSPPNFAFTDSIIPTCPGVATGQIHLAFAGGNTPFSFNWSNGSGNPNLAVPSGLTSLTITDSLGCSIDTSFMISTYPMPLVAAVGSNVFCHGDSTGTMTAFPFPGGFEPWEFALENTDSFQTDPLFTGLPAGNYIVYFRDSVGCIYSSNGVIAQSDSFNVSLGSTVDPQCGNDSSGFVELIVSGAVSPYQFGLDTNSLQANDTIFNLPAGSDTIIIVDNIGCTTEIPFSLTAPPPLFIGVDTFIDLTCFMSADGMAEISAAGGISPYTYSVDGMLFQTDSVFTGLAADTLTFYIADSINCRDSVSVVLSQPDTLQLGSAGSALLCFGDSNGIIELFPMGGTLPYVFINNSDTTSVDTLFNLQEGVYNNISVLDANGCSASTVDSVVAPTQLSIDSVISDSTLCNSTSDGQLTVFVSGAVPPYQYSLNNTAFQPANTFTGLSAGNYTVYVQDDNGCLDSITTMVAEPIPNVVALLPDSLINHVSCNGANDGSVMILIQNGAAPFQFSIDGGANYQASNSFSGLAAGTYMVLVQDANGCTDQTTFTVNEPAAFQLSTSTMQTTCFNGSDGSISISTTGGTTPYIYSIDNGNNYQVDSFFNNLPSGNYNISVLDSNGCQSTTTVFVDQPPEFILTALPTAVSCFGYFDGSVELLVSGGTGPFNAFSISDDGINFISQGTGTFTGIPSGNYIAVASDANGCPANTNFIISEPPLDTFNIQIDPTSCFGSQFVNGVITIADANVNPPYLFSLDGSSFSFDTVFAGLASGLHTLIWQNINGCQDTLELWVDEPDPILVFITPDTLVLPLSQSQQVSSNVVGPSNVTYQWLPSDGLSCSDCPDPVVSPYGPSPAVYSLLVEVDDADANPPCFGTGELVVIIDHLPNYFFPNAFTPNGDGENDVLYVYGEHIKSIDLQIYNRWGVKIFESRSPNFGWDGRFRGEMMEPDVYPYKLTVEYLSGETDYEQGSVTLIR